MRTLQWLGHQRFFLGVFASWWFNGLLLAATVSGHVVLVDSAERPGKKSHDYSGVVVWLEPAESGLREPPPTLQRAVMAQKNKTFTPHVLAVEAGTAVDFPNFDPIFHNAFSNYNGQVFDLHLYAPQTSRRIVFRHPGMVRVFCNIHATMSAVIAVLPTPYFAVTGPDGRFRIQAPEGSYRFQVWHERSGTETLSKLERRIRLTRGETDLAEIRVSELGYLAVPHKNKFGHDYPPAPDDHVFYPGGKR
jgi:plastocyanin